VAVRVPPAATADLRQRLQHEYQPNDEDPSRGRRRCLRAHPVVHPRPMSDRGSLTCLRRRSNASRLSERQEEPVTSPSAEPQAGQTRPDPRAEAQAYAWNWFALHAGQRMQLVNFWLVAVAFLSAAFVQATTAKLTVVAVGVCVAGAVASIAFALLDARTRRLVQVAEAALRDLEDERVAAGAHVSTQLVLAAETARGGGIFSYRFIIQSLQLTIAALFVAAAFYALLA
jgi:Flp pilus assembly protein TadB